MVGSAGNDGERPLLQDAPAADTSVESAAEVGGARAPIRVPRAGPPPSRAVWPVGLACAALSAFGWLSVLVASLDDRDSYLAIPLAAAAWAVVVLPMALAAGGLAARVEAQTAPRLPRRDLWLRLAVLRITWLYLLPLLLWSPAHVLALLADSEYRAEAHLLSAALGLLVWGAAAVAGWRDRRVSQTLAERTPVGEGSASRLDRVSSSAWLALLAGAAFAVPGVAAGAAGIQARGDSAVIALAWAMVAVFGALCALGVRVGVFGSLPGGRRSGLRAAAVTWAAAWIWLYGVALAAGDAGAGSGQHAGRLVVSVLAAAALVAGVGVFAAARERAVAG
jgi:hypothetical protein